MTVETGNSGVTMGGVFPGVYFGQWANPHTLKTFSYVEGDVTLCEAETVDEFVAHVRNMAAWHQENNEFRGIDTMCREPLRARFVEIGLGDLLH